MYSKVVVVRNPSGLHARPASEFVSKAKNFQSKISIRRPGDSSFLGNAKVHYHYAFNGDCSG